ncbi:hypothetical protein [Lysinibacillus sp. OF-1]|uniref:hypothetical protein n=1 Tax=Lysinibacillus sp. OF-1 TaxID=2972483 RepID=UPI00232E7F44|nr:hypothetical protein [Lysinibacillus sp. OF-1]WCH47014.1 hypothetical protein NV349_18525 [Lysinibacillus sp. OF-1]
MKINHVLLPNLELDEKFQLPKEYKVFLNKYLENLYFEIASDSIAMSEAVNGIIAELLLYKELRVDWYEIVNELLEYNETPIAYSENYGKKLFGFDSQWLQTDVHCIYNHRFIMQLLKKPMLDYEHLILQLVQPNGYIYNPTVSITNPKTRMKSELFMSLAMGFEIVGTGKIPEISRKIISNLEHTNYIAAEYFKIRALKIINKDINQYIILANENLLQKCNTGNGYADFDVKDKIDDYMGTTKRISRDKMVGSPLITNYASELSKKLTSESQEAFNESLIEYSNHLRVNPLDILAFKMRDLEADFGESITPFEVFSAYVIINKNK